MRNQQRGQGVQLHESSSRIAEGRLGSSGVGLSRPEPAKISALAERSDIGRIVNTRTALEVEYIICLPQLKNRCRNSG